MSEPGIEWVRRANDRHIGETEFRQVEMIIGSGRNPRRLKIRTLRQSDQTHSKTVFCVMEPSYFRNINYVVSEERGKIEPFIIQLYLPYVLGSLLDLPSNRRREGHLGSDFSYDDLRTWSYEEGHNYDIPVHEGNLVRIGGLCRQSNELVRHGSNAFDLWLREDSLFLSGIDYWSSKKTGVIRKYRAKDIHMIDGVQISGEMTMEDFQRGHMTIIRLERAWFDREIDEQIFSPEFRKNTRDYLLSL